MLLAHTCRVPPHIYASRDFGATNLPYRVASFFYVAEPVAFVCLPLAGGWALGRAGEQAGRVAIVSRQAVGPGIHYGGIEQAGEELAGNPGADGGRRAGCLSIGGDRAGENPAGNPGNRRAIASQYIGGRRDRENKFGCLLTT